MLKKPGLQKHTGNRQTLILCLILTALCTACAAQHLDSTRQQSQVIKSETKVSPVASERDALQKLCVESSHHTGGTVSNYEDLRNGDARALRQANKGIGNARKLLPLAKELTIATFRRHAADFHLSSVDLEQIEKYITAVNSIMLDESLENVAEVDDEKPQEILVGAEYALTLTEDEEAILLLCHELTHVAVWSGRLAPFIENSAQMAGQTAGVFPTEDQQEDLACDYVGAQALKQFIRLRPNRESAAARLSLALGNGCEPGTVDDEGDEEHLSEGETLRALIGLDPELKSMILHN